VPRRPAQGKRDQPASAFTFILSDLVARVPGASAAALVDAEGETVDYAGRGDPFEMRVAAAHWRIVLDASRTQPSLTTTRSLAVRAVRRSFVIQSLPDGYALVLLLSGGGGGFWGSRRAIVACAGMLAQEAGWGRDSGASWCALEVISDERNRPSRIRVGGITRRVEVLGRLASGLGSRERGWRVRLDNGVEVTLVREPGGFWYTDEPINDQFAAGPKKSLTRGRR
jgi:predicted regulator of Ras-like GTPase activity (Roadblock/LC7/MglB family)